MDSRAVQRVQPEASFLCVSPSLREPLTSRKGKEDRERRGEGGKRRGLPLERYTLDIEIVERTWHALPPLLEYMGVDHRGRYILVTQQGLDGPNIGAAL